MPYGIAPRRALRLLLTAVLALLPVLLVTAPSPAAAQVPGRAAGFVGSCPTTGFISQYYSQEHNGIDIANERGTPIYAVGDGEVTVSGYESGYGQWIRVLHPDGTITEYGHMYQRDVQVGDHVVAGQRIALMGAEGQATGPHLHLRVWADAAASVRTDPIPYLADRGIDMPCTPGTGPHPKPLVYPAESGRVVSGRSADGRLEVFVAGADGVHHAWQVGVNGAWSEWELLGGPGGAELAISPNADGRLEVFAINGSVFQHRYQLAPSGGWSGWEDFGGGGRDIAVGANGDGRMEVFASGPAGVFHRYQTAANGGWSGWESAGGGPANSQIEMEKASDGRLEVFAINGDVFQHQYQTAVNGGWSVWEDFGGGGHDVTVDHNQDGRLEVFASGPKGVFHKYQTNSTSWSGWEPTGGPADSQLTSERSPDGRVEVFALTPGGTAILHRWQQTPGGTWSAWERFGTAAGAAPRVARDGSGRLTVAAIAPSGVGRLPAAPVGAERRMGRLAAPVRLVDRRSAARPQCRRPLGRLHARARRRAAHPPLAALPGRSLGPRRGRHRVRRHAGRHPVGSGRLHRPPAPLRGHRRRPGTHPRTGTAQRRLAPLDRLRHPRRRSLTRAGPGAGPPLVRLGRPRTVGLPVSGRSPGPSRC